MSKSSNLKIRRRILAEGKRRDFIASLKNKPPRQGSRKKEEPIKGDWLVQVSTRSLPYSKSQKMAIVITCEGKSRPQSNEFYTPPVTVMPPIDPE